MPADGVFNPMPSTNRSAQPNPPPQSPRRARAHHSTGFVLISRWRMGCDSNAVWDLLTRLEAWPQWWPQVTQARVVHQAPLGESGTRVILTWRTLLGYGLKIDVVNTRRQRDADGHCEIEGRSAGDLLGYGLWVIEPLPCGAGSGPAEVDVTYRYEVELNKGWMRLLAPLLRHLFAWNHFAVMRSGAGGMAKRLGCSSSRPVNWTAGRH
jgi:hypothetical protein